MTAYSYQEPKLTPEQEWVKVSRQIFGELNKYSGLDLAYRLPASLEGLSEAEQNRAVVMAGQAANDRRGYLQALEPLRRRVMAGQVVHTDAKVWKLTFAIGKHEFRPKYGEVEELVLSVFEIPRTGADALARAVMTAPSILGIPSATSAAAVKDISALPKKAKRLSDIPERDDKGNLIGEGRRKFILAMLRMKQGLRPLPSADPFDEPDTEGHVPMTEGQL